MELNDHGVKENNSPWMGFPEQNKEIFDTIIQKIGKFWRILGSNLKIRERVIQDIDIQYETSDEKATILMEKYIAIADPQRWFFVLCDALERTQREDLVRSIKDIMARNNYLSMFEPFGVEALGPWGPRAHRVVRDISKQLVDSSSDQRAGLFFGQRISVAIQYGNAASVLGTFPIDIEYVDEFFDAQ